MNRATIAALLLGVMTMPAAQSATPRRPQRTPPGSFLRYRALSVSELAHQISTDRAVRLKYARHFHVTPDRIVAALTSGLRLVSLTRPLRTRSWYVGTSGAIHVKTKLLPKGTPVFVSSDGRPLLAWSCGNPLRPGSTWRSAGSNAQAGALPEALTPPKAKKAKAAGAPVASTDVETKVLAGPVETVMSAALAAAPGFVSDATPAATAPTNPSVANTPPDTAIPSAGGAAPAIVPAMSSGLGGLGAIGGLAALLGSLSASHQDSHNPSVQPIVSPIAPVPDPNGLLVLGTGLSAALGSSGMRRLRERRSQRIPKTAF